MRIKVTEEVIDQVFNACRETLKAKMVKHGDGAFYSKHECFGKIAEEVDELLDELRDDEHPEKFENELLDVAVAAIFSAVSMIEMKKLVK